MYKLSHHRGVVAWIGIAGLLAACDSPSDKTGDAPADKPAASAEPTKEEPKGDTKPAAAEPVELVEHDLSSADPSWAGWTAKAPKDAKVMVDGVKGARIAGKGPNMLERKAGKIGGFDVAFAWDKKDLKVLKENLQKGADAAKEIEMKLSFTKDEADQLMWTSEAKGDNYESTKYNFVIHMNVDGKDVSCQNNYMVGIDTEELREQHLEACKSLAKK